MSCLLLILPVRSQKPEYPCIIRNFLRDLDNKNKYLHVKSTSAFILFLTSVKIKELTVTDVINCQLTSNRDYNATVTFN